MARAMKICGKPGCPAVTTGRLCTTHAREADKARGSREARGYDAAHRSLRQSLAVQVETGRVRCARCGEYIKPDAAWHLDHSDDRTGYLGASCAPCNLSAAGRAAHKYD